MTKNLTVLCDLFDKTEIDYEIIAENEISVETMALGLEYKNPQFATDQDLDNEGLWEGETYVHIIENHLGLFTMVTAKAVRYNDD